MTKFFFFFFIFRVNLFAVSQSYSLQNSWFTVNSSDLRFLLAYRIFVSSAAAADDDGGDDSDDDD